MSLTHAQLLHALAMAQAADVAPALAGGDVDLNYAAGSAATIAGLLMFAASDAASLAARETAAASAARHLLDPDCDGRDARQAALAARLVALEAAGDAAGWQSVMALLAAEAAADWAALGLQ
jgi:hypothetical protein